MPVIAEIGNAHPVHQFVVSAEACLHEAKDEASYQEIRGHVMSEAATMHPESITEIRDSWPNNYAAFRRIHPAEDMS